MKTLYLYLRDFSFEETEEETSYSGTIAWLTDDDENADALQGECHVMDLKTQLDAHHDDTQFNSTILFLDDSYTLFVREKIPGRTIPQIRRALPFAVENYLSIDLEHTHIAHGPISRTNAIDCVAIDSEILGNILQALRESAVYPTVCTTFGMQIPNPEGEHDVHVVKDESNAWVRTREHLALVSVETLPDVISTLSGHREPVPQIQIWNYGGDYLEFYDQSMYEPQTHEHTDQTLISFAADQYEPSNCINLLQGKYSSKDTATVNVRRWILTGVFAIACLYAYIASQASEGLWAAFKANTVQNEMKTHFLDIFQEEPRGRDIARQMRNRLGVSGDSTRAFDMLIERLAEVVASPSHAPKIDSIKYESGRQKLDIAFTISNHEAMEAFIRSLGNDKINVDRGPAETRERLVRANLTLTLNQ